MCLKVVERGEFKDIIIREGEVEDGRRHKSTLTSQFSFPQVFMLPAKIQHSPQRFANTIGFVCERTRASHEKDGLKYFVDASQTELYERWFHLEDVVKGAYLF